MPSPRQLLLGLSLTHALGAHHALAPNPGRTAADSVPTTVRWTRLIPRLADEATAARKAAKAAATAAHDSLALKRLAQSQPPVIMRVYILLSVAQYGAVNSVRDPKVVSPEVAVASASAAVLDDFFTDSVTRGTIRDALADDVELAGRSSNAASRIEAGGRVGDAVARRVLADSPPFNVVAPWSGTVPTGPGKWYSAPGLPPIGIALAHARGWLIDSASQFRPAPPPAFGSREWQAALDEVRRVSRERTAEQTRIAQLWDSGDPWTRWSEIAITEILRSHLSDADAARVLVLMNVAAMDAEIACFEAKYYYWTIRPSQADTSLVLADKVGLPNFPSFPSGHACSAGAFDAVMGHFFPAQRAQFTTMAEEQAMSRLYGGIHYRFDNDGGLALGRIVARYAVAREQQGGLNGWRYTGNESSSRP